MTKFTFSKRKDHFHQWFGVGRNPLEVSRRSSSQHGILCAQRKSWEIEHWRIDALELWCWRWLLRVSGTARRSNQSILKEISPEYSLEGLMLKLKLLILWPPYAKNWLIGKDPNAGKDWRWEEKGMTEDEMVGWHHRLYGHEFD